MPISLDLVIHLSIPALGQFFVLKQSLATFNKQFGGFSSDHRIRRDRLQNQGHGAYAATATDNHWSQNGRAHANGNIILDCRMAFAQPTGTRSPPASCAKGDLVIEHNIIADNRRFADYHARAMIDKKPFADLCARMNLDASCNQAREL